MRRTTSSNGESIMKTKAMFVTGSRADYGLLKPLIDLFRADRAFQTEVIATGMHLSPEFGSTFRAIEKDGVSIAKKIVTLMSSDDPAGIAKSIAAGLSGFAEIFETMKPDVLILLGDRFEIFAAASAALVFRIPIAHIHGGEVSEGAFDDCLRHCLTKMSHLHFTSTEQYRQRVIQLGENPDFVFNVGAIGIDNIRNTSLLSRRELERELGLVFKKRVFLVTFHPVTLEDDTTEGQFRRLLAALDKFPDATTVFTKANADTHGRIINRLIDGYQQERPGRARGFDNLGQRHYLSLLKAVSVVIGNSSSGIIEAPSLKTPTVNIGDRQKGRIKAASVIDCEPTEASIVKAIRRVETAQFRRKLESLVNPYGNGGTAKRIKAIIGKSLPRVDVKKHFHDL
jgi:GDP/UDP-N,N'-diacetylbacillosamine 2-epimerase (hydrolysing)